MAEILLFHPLIILYVIYVVGLLLAAIWSDALGPPRRPEDTEPGEALGARGLSCPGSHFRPRVTIAFRPWKGEKP
jgi:hypothetical protein